MRPGQNNRRSRGRGNNNSNANRRPNTPNRNQTFDSNGPDTRIRGTAFQVAEKYQTLARDAASAGDRVLAENYLQHAEHYQRIINAMAEATQQREQPPNGRFRGGRDEAAEAEEATEAVAQPSGDEEGEAVAESAAPAEAPEGTGEQPTIGESEDLFNAPRPARPRRGRRPQRAAQADQPEGADAPVQEAPAGTGDQPTVDAAGAPEAEAPAPRPRRRRTRRSEEAPTPEAAPDPEG